MLNFTNVLEAEWEQIPAVRFENLVVSLPRRVKAATAADGFGMTCSTLHRGVMFWSTLQSYTTKSSDDLMSTIIFYVPLIHSQSQQYNKGSQADLSCLINMQCVQIMPLCDL